MESVMKQRREAKGLSQYQLAARVPGLEQSSVSQLESGEHGLGMKRATKIAAELGGDPAEYVVSNQLARHAAAMVAGDRAGALNAVKAINEAASTTDLSPSDEAVLDKLVEDTINFASGSKGKYAAKAADPEEVYDHPSVTGRDRAGYSKKSTKSSAYDGESFAADFISVKGMGSEVARLHGLDEDEDEDDYDDFDDGRDINGIRIAPLNGSREED